jgi:hypothetical protein
MPLPSSTQDSFQLVAVMVISDFVLAATSFTTGVLVGPSPISRHSFCMRHQSLGARHSRTIENNLSFTLERKTDAALVLVDPRRS